MDDNNPAFNPGSKGHAGIASLLTLAPKSHDRHTKPFQLFRILKP